MNTELFDFVYDGILQLQATLLYKGQTEQGLKNIFTDKTVWKLLGVPFKMSLMEGPFFVKKEEIRKPDDLTKIAITTYSAAETIFTFLWFIRDSGGHTPSIGFYGQDGTVGFLYKNNSYTNANGEFTTTKFHPAEILEAIKLYKEYISVIPINKHFDFGQDFLKGGIYRGMNPSEKYNKANRVERAMSFLSIARSSADLPNKIAFYVLVLECLFSANDGTELTHKIRERVALYMEEDYNKRKEIFENVKIYYALRSKYVHGQELESKHDNIEFLRKTSCELDDLIRRIFLKIIKHDSIKFLLPEKQFKEWFNEMLLGNYSE
jgi:hypothetical protein